MRTLGIAISLCVIASAVTGCWAAAAGAGAEAGYVMSQRDRTAAQTVDDQRITTAVKTGLMGDEGLRAFSINVDTFKGAVTLTGPVNTQAEADRAVRIARDVSGVNGVRSKLRVESGRARAR